MLSPRNLGGVAVAGRICASPAFRRTDRIRRPRRAAMRARRPAGGAYRDGTNPRRASPLCSAGTSRLSRRSERTRHALDWMPGPSVRSGLVPGAHTNLVGLAYAIRWQAWTHERTLHRGCGLNRRRGINPAAAAIRTNPSPGAGPWPGSRIAVQPRPSVRSPDCAAATVERTREAMGRGRRQRPPAMA